MSVCVFARQFCLFVRCLLSSYSPFEFPGARRPFFLSISLLSNISSSVRLLTFLRSLFYYLFIDWFCVRLVSLVLSLVRLMFYGCVGLSLTFIWFGGREAEYDVVPVRELMIMTPFPVAASCVWLVDAACVWVLCLILIFVLCIVDIVVSVGAFCFMFYL